MGNRKEKNQGMCVGAHVYGQGSPSEQCLKRDEVEMVNLFTRYVATNVVDSFDTSALFIVCVSIAVEMRRLNASKFA